MLTLCSCSIAKVHLYTRYLSEAEIEKIITKLEKKNFKVIPNTLVFPEKIKQSTLLYSPLIQSVGKVDEIVKSLSGLGWPAPNIESLVTSNHKYTKDNIGLYLISENEMQNDRITELDFAHIYASSNCEITLNIQLNADNTYQMFYRNQIYNDEIEHLNGSWKMRSFPQIELTSNNEEWWFYFEVEKHIETDRIGQIEILELKPADNYQFFPHCSFVHGLRL